MGRSAMSLITRLRGVEDKHLVNDLNGDERTNAALILPYCRVMRSDDTTTTETFLVTMIEFMRRGPSFFSHLLNPEAETDILFMHRESGVGA